METGQAEEKETLYRYQLDVRKSAKELHGLLVAVIESSEKAEARPRQANIEEMIEYECETWSVLKEVIEQARKLGYKE